MKKIYALIGSLLCLGIATAQAQYTDLVDFTGITGSYIGVAPHGELTLAFSGVFYGMTLEAPIGPGNIFSYDPGTNTYTDLVDFTGDTGSYIGEHPQGSLTLSSSGVFYGMTEEGGTYSSGVIFSYDPSTHIYSDLVNFTGPTGAYIGGDPVGSLTLSSSGIFYGMTFFGGTHGNGAVFSYDPGTHIYTDLVDFTEDTGSYRGGHPRGDVTLSSSGVLYGMTGDGGTHGNGIIFSYDTGTHIYTDLVDFTGDTGSYIGAFPSGSLTLSSSGVFYGMTTRGSALGLGNIFSYDPGTNIYTDLVDFTGDTGSCIGAFPGGSLTLSSSGVLYGMTNQGGTIGWGNIFSYDIGTHTYSDLVDFTVDTGSYIGGEPDGDLTLLSSGIFYGMTLEGIYGNGNIFSYVPPVTTSSPVYRLTREDINLEPNPNNGLFTIAGMENGMTIEMYDCTARKINSLMASNKTMQLNISDQPNGIYLIRILDNNGNLVGQRKLVKTN